MVLPVLADSCPGGPDFEDTRATRAQSVICDLPAWRHHHRENDHELHYKLHCEQVRNADGAVDDEWTLVQHNHGPFAGAGTKKATGKGGGK